MSRSKYLIKNTALYTVSTISSKMISFFMVSFYTSVLTKEIYGQLDVIFATINLLIPIVALSINNSILRFSLDKNANKNNIFKVGCMVTAAGTIAVVLIASILRLFLTYDWLILAAILLIIEIWYLLFAEFIRGMDKNGLYVLSNIMLVIFVALLNILFLGYFKLGIYGYLLAYIISYVICSLFLVFLINPFKVLKSANPTTLKTTMHEMLRYCVFLIPNSIFWWITISSDKYIIIFLIGSAFNGIYSVSNKVPTLITYSFQIFIQAWQLSAIKEQGKENEKEFVNDIYKGLFSVLSVAVSLFLLIIKPFISIYVNKEYYSAWQAASILGVTAMFNILSSFVGIRYVVIKDNKRNMYTTLLGAGINIILNFILIPKCKLIGAAIATLVSYFVVFIVRIIDTKKYLPITILKEHYLILMCIVIQLVMLFNDDIIGIISGLIFFAAIGIINGRHIKNVLIMFRRKQNENKVFSQENS